MLRSCVPSGRGATQSGFTSFSVAKRLLAPHSRGATRKDFSRVRAHPPIPVADVFISYSRKDKDFVQRLDEELKRRGRGAWVDWEGIPPSAEFMEEIYGAIEATDSFLFVLSPDSVSSKVCGEEIARAVARNKRMVPLVAREVDPADVAPALAKLNWIYCRESDPFDAATEKLLSALDTDLPWVRAHTRLLIRASEWEAKGRNKSLRLHGDDLRSAEQWLTAAGADKERQPTALQTEYIIASRNAETQQQRKWLAAVSIGLLITAALAVMVWFAKQEAVKQGEGAKTTAVQADSDLALTFRGDAVTPNPRMFPYLARALRISPAAILPRRYLVSLLRDRSWILPQTEPLRHGGIKAAAFSPDGRLLVTISTDQTARIWEVKTGQPVGEPLLIGDAMLHNDVVLAIDFSPDGTQMVTCTDHRMVMWNILTGESLGELPSLGFGEFSTAQWSRDGQRILSMASTGVLGVWNVHTKKPIGAPIKAISISPDGAYAVGYASFENDEIQLWKLDTVEAIGTPWGKAEGIDPQVTNRWPHATFSHDSQRFAVCAGAIAYVFNSKSGQRLAGPLLPQQEFGGIAFSSDGRRLVTRTGPLAQIWEADTGQPSGRPLSHTEDLDDAGFSPDGTRLLTCGGSTNSAALWDVQSGKRIGTELAHEDAISVAAFSPDGLRVITASLDKTARLWDARTGEPLGEPLRHDAAVSIAKFTPQGESVLTVSSDNLARLWEAPRESLASRPLPLGSGATVVMFGPDGRQLAIGFSDGSVVLCDPRTGRNSESKPHHGESIQALAFSSDGRLLATGSIDKTAQLWDAATGQPKGPPLPHDAAVEAIAFSSDGKRILTRDFNVRVWDVEAGSQICVLGPALTTVPSRSMNMVRIIDAALSPDGRFVYTHTNSASIGEQIWDVNTGKLVPELSERLSDARWITTGLIDGIEGHWRSDPGSPLQFALRHLAHFSPDQKRVLTWSDNRAFVWDAATGHQLGESLRHKEKVELGMFTSDGVAVVTGADNEIRFWDSATGKAFSEPILHQRSLDSAAVSPDGRRVATICQGVAQIRDVATDRESKLPPWVAELAEAVGNRRLDERSTLVLPEKSLLTLRRELMDPTQSTFLKGDDFWSCVGRWFFTRGPARTLSPDSKVTAEELSHVQTKTSMSAPAVP